MRKSDKKLDNQIRSGLTDVCEAALKDLEGFQWLTHLVNFNNFPQSLKVICVFDTNDSLDNYLLSGKNDYIQSLIVSELQKLDISLKSVRNQILFDTEENCKSQHNGNWSKRLG